MCCDFGSELYGNLKHLERKKYFESAEYFSIKCKQASRIHWKSPII